MTRKILLYIVIDSLLIIGVLFYFFRSEPVEDQKVSTTQEATVSSQVFEPKSTPHIEKLEVTEENTPIVEPVAQASTEEHRHQHNTTRLITPERDELGLSTHSAAQPNKAGYPSILSTNFSYMKSSQIPAQAADVRVIFAEQIEMSGVVISSSVQESISSLGIKLITTNGTSMILHLMFDEQGELNRGFILAPKDKYSYTITPSSSGQVLVEAVERERILPDEEGYLPAVPTPIIGESDSNLSTTEAVVSVSSSGTSAAPPILESRPGATGVIYLDFDGHTTTNTSWNFQVTAGAPIVSAAASLTDAQITEIWQRVSESFSPFTINVTTSLDVFRAAAGTQKIRAVISPSSTWYGPGGLVR